MADYVRNKKAWFNFEILETFEAGLVLHGFEAKAIRKGKAKLDGSYIIMKPDGAYLKGAHIAPYQPPNTPDNYDPERERKLLLSAKELEKLGKELNTAGLTIVPLRLYNSGRNVKLEIALVRGKKKADKRETLKKRDAKREIERTLKNQY